MRILIALVAALLVSACGDSGKSEDKESYLLSTSIVTPASAVVHVPELSISSMAASAASVVSSTEVIGTNEEQPLPIDFYKPKFNASDPAAPLEVSVLTSLGEGGVFILPIMSIPLHPEQFPRGLNGREKTMFMSLIAPLIALPQSADQSEPISPEEEEREVKRRGELLVAQTNKMSSVPETWLDSEGNRYEADGAAPRDDGVVGGALGFELRSAPKKEKQRLVNRMVLNRVEGFPARRTVQDNEWKQWKGLTDELSAWSKKQISECSDQLDCRKAVGWLTALEHIKGEAYEYRLGDGRKLRYIQAESKSKKSVLERRDEVSTDQGDVLQISLWMLANTDGAVRVLRGDQWSSVGLEDHFCDSQCSARWTGHPEVVSWQDQSFIVGAYSGGTLYGYVVFEVLPEKLRYVGRFAWGS